MSFSQKVFEISDTYDISFKVYAEKKIYKLESNSDVSLESPEKTARTFFFALNNDILRSTYSDPKKSTDKTESHYDNIKKLNKNDGYIQLLHKMNYKFKGEDRCYIMFFAKIKDIPFSFPTLLSLRTEISPPLRTRKAGVLILIFPDSPVGKGGSPKA